jgi:predicted MPP superfamily phosphohydrolase
LGWGRFFALLIAAALVSAGLVVAIGYHNAISPPIVRRLDLTVADYPADAAPVRIALFSDLHVHGPDMPPARVGRIVEQINGLHPDIIVGAGDFTGHNLIGAHYPIEQAVAPLSQLRARLGVFAVLGNADYDAGAARTKRALERIGIRVLANDAAAVGPVALGGLNGRIYRAAPWKVARATTYQAMDRTPGIKVLVAHRPDEFEWAPSSIRLVLAGHTHCGQIVLPWIGPLETGSDYGSKFLCGIIRNGAKVMIVTAGLGTSRVPIRIGAPPDIWIVSIRRAQ